MLSLVDNCDKETLCPKCNLRAIYCEADLYKCDCCACDQNLCVPMDHNKVVNPFITDVKKQAERNKKNKVTLLAILRD